jgi:type II secretory pathway component GspD/PulD (secretin)
MNARRAVAVSVVMTLLGSGLPLAQEKAASEDKPSPRPVPRSFRARVTAHRQVAGKRVDSVPYEFVVREGQESWLQVGTEVPIPVTTFTSLGEKSSLLSPATSFQYKNVGVRIVCVLSDPARSNLPPGTAQARLTVEQSTRSATKTEIDGRVLPHFESSNTRSDLVMKLGEVYHVATVRQPGSEEALEWDVALLPLR